MQAVRMLDKKVKNLRKRISLSFLALSLPLLVSCLEQEKIVDADLELEDACKKEGTCSSKDNYSIVMKLSNSGLSQFSEDICHPLDISLSQLEQASLISAASSLKDEKRLDPQIQVYAEGKYSGLHIFKTEVDCLNKEHGSEVFVADAEKVMRLWISATAVQTTEVILKSELLNSKLIAKGILNYKLVAKADLAPFARFVFHSVHFDKMAPGDCLELDLFAQDENGVVRAVPSDTIMYHDLRALGVSNNGFGLGIGAHANCAKVALNTKFAKDSVRKSVFLIVPANMDKNFQLVYSVAAATQGGSSVRRQSDAVFVNTQPIVEKVNVRIKDQPKYLFMDQCYELELNALTRNEQLYAEGYAWDFSLHRHPMEASFMSWSTSAGCNFQEMEAWKIDANTAKRSLKIRFDKKIAKEKGFHFQLRSGHFANSLIDVHFPVEVLWAPTGTGIYRPDNTSMSAFYNLQPSSVVLSQDGETLERWSSQRGALRSISNAVQCSAAECPKFADAEVVFAGKQRLVPASTSSNTQQLSVGVRFKLAELPTEAVPHRLISFSSYYIDIVNYKNQAYLRLYLSGAKPTLVYDGVLSESLQMGDWNNIVVTANRTKKTLSLRVNGQDVFVTDNATAMLSTSMALGALSNGFVGSVKAAISLLDDRVSEDLDKYLLYRFVD